MIIGTDIYGRDILSRVMFGARISLFGGVVIIFFAALIGIPIGLWAGYNEGISGIVISRVVELFLSVPSTLIAMGISILVGAGWQTAIIAIGLLIFIGLGTQPPTADWGLMVWEGAPNILSEWWISIVPGCVMFMVVITFNIFGDTLKDILDSNG